MASRFYGAGVAPLRGISRRIVPALLAAILAFSTFISAIVIVQLHDHDCPGEDCPTCLVLDMSQAVLSSSAAPVAPATAAAIATFGTCLIVALWAVILRAETPVTGKVKLLI